MITSDVLSVYDYARHRHGLLLSRLAGEPASRDCPPEIIAHKFTNVHRFADRTSQKLISIINDDETRGLTFDETLFRVMWFRAFNSTRTWDALDPAFSTCGTSFDAKVAQDVIVALVAGRSSVYHGAYTISVEGLGSPTRGEVPYAHLALLCDRIDYATLATRLGATKSINEAAAVVRELPTYGAFTWFQLAVDIGYTSHVSWSEHDALASDVTLGPGARRCGEDLADVYEDLAPFTLQGMRPSVVDCEHTMCEYDKYTRATYTRPYKPHGARQLPSIIIPRSWERRTKGQ